MKKKMTRNAMVMILAVSLSLMTACGVNGTAPEASTAAADGTVAYTAAATSTNELTATAAVTTSAAAETTGETAAETTTVTTAALPAVTALAAPATYAASFDTVRIYTDASRTKVQAVLAKGGQVTITGTAEKYGVTAEGFYVNLNLMTLIITATPVPVETTAATTKETTKPTPKPTKETTAETEAPVETAAPPVETAAPVATTAAPATDYTAMCAEIKSALIAILEANGKWDPNFTGTVASWGQKWWGVGWYDDGDMTTQGFADEYYNGKFAGGTITACGVDCYVADGKIYLDYQGYAPA